MNEVFNPSRRKVLQGLAGLAGAEVLYLVEPPIKTIAETARLLERKTGWSIVPVREGDTPLSLCHFYGIFNHEDIRLVLEANCLKDPFFPKEKKQTLILPISPEIRKRPFDKIVYFLDSEHPKTVEITDLLNKFYWGDDKVAYYDGDNFFGVFHGHSSNQLPELYPFHGLIRRLEKQFGKKIPVWISRLTPSLGESWIKCTLSYHYTAYTADANSVYSWPNSTRIVFTTCVSERSNPEARWYTLANIENYSSGKPPKTLRGG